MGSEDTLSFAQEKLKPNTTEHTAVRIQRFPINTFFERVTTMSINTLLVKGDVSMSMSINTAEIRFTYEILQPFTELLLLFVFDDTTHDTRHKTHDTRHMTQDTKGLGSLVLQHEV